MADERRIILYRGQQVATPHPEPSELGWRVTGTDGDGVVGVAGSATDATEVTHHDLTAAELLRCNPLLLVHHRVQRPGEGVADWMVTGIGAGGVVNLRKGLRTATASVEEIVDLNAAALAPRIEVEADS